MFTACGTMRFKPRREDPDFVCCMLFDLRHSLSQYETARNTRQAVALVCEDFITIRVSIDHLHLETRYESSPELNALALSVMVLASCFRSAPSTPQQFTHKMMDPATMTDARNYMTT